METNNEKYRKALDLGVELREMEEEADLEELAEDALEDEEQARFAHRQETAEAFRRGEQFDKQAAGVRELKEEARD
jgi:hypothetical protein